MLHIRLQRLAGIDHQHHLAHLGSQHTRFGRQQQRR